MANYLFIHDDTTIWHGTKINNDEFNSCLDGYLDIVDITDPSNPKQITFDDDGKSSFVAIESKNSD